MLSRESIYRISEAAANRYFTASGRDHPIELMERSDGSRIYIPYDLGAAVVSAYFDDPKIRSGKEWPRNQYSRYGEIDRELLWIKHLTKSQLQLMYIDEGGFETEETKRKALADHLTSRSALSSLSLLRRAVR